jgi:ribosomal protein S18 acetylase RimI-like enzyme
MDILPATLRDLNGLRHLEQACFPTDGWPLLDLVAVLTWAEVIRLKAVEDEKMVGFIAGDPRPRENLAWIATLAVAPEFQRRGIGLALLEACEQKIKQPRLRLCVRVSNESAIQLYKKAGYLAIDTWKQYYNDQENALVMEKIRHAEGL